MNDKVIVPSVFWAMLAIEMHGRWSGSSGHPGAVPDAATPYNPTLPNNSHATYCRSLLRPRRAHSGGWTPHRFAEILRLVDRKTGEPK